MDECIFCKIVKKEIPSELIGESDNFIAIYDINPVVKGHALVFPKKHFKTTLDFPNVLASELISFIKEISMKLMKEYDCGGFNLVNNNYRVADQIVDHVHFHIIPRKKEDGVRVLQKCE